MKLLEDINKYFTKYGKGTVLLYIRSRIYNNLYNWAKAKNKSELYHEYSTKREEDLKNAIKIDKIDTNCLITEGVTRNNLTKLFFMVLPEMDDYQPKVLVDYTNLFCGFKQFYTIFRFIKKIKKEKSIFTENKYKENAIKKYNMESDTLLHYFIRNKYFAQFNLSEYFFNPFSENKNNNDISIISLSKIDFANSKINENSIENELNVLNNENNKEKSNQSNAHLSNLKNNPMYKNIGIQKINKQNVNDTDN